MRISSRVADRLEQLVAVVFYAFLTWRLIAAGLPNLQVWAVLVSDGTILAFLLIRRPTEGISMRIDDWLIAVIGTSAALLIEPAHPPIDATIGVLVMFTGMTVSIAAKLVLRRSFGLVAANRGVKVGGLYGLVRHPMYAGYMITHVGTLLVLPSLWNVAVYAVAWTGLVLRLRAEERVLMADETYAAYVARVPYRLVPGVF